MMLILISPSKTMDFTTDTSKKEFDRSSPLFIKEANELMLRLKNAKPEEIKEKEKVSTSIAYQVYQYNQTFFHTQLQKAAIFAFHGNVYNKLDVKTLSVDSLDFLQKHLYILSGLYGVLYPFDRIKPHRLDPNSRLLPGLYPFWKTKVTDVVNKQLAHENKLIINLASSEYFKLVEKKLLPEDVCIITPVFQSEKNGKKIVSSLYIKEARGLMLRYIAQHKITDPELLKGFNSEGYFFDPYLSDDSNWYFIR